MPEPSKFQTLPFLVADSIAHYLVNVKGSVRSLYPHIQAGYTTELAEAAAKQWKILYNISRCWRELALGHFCKKATVKIDAETLDHLEVTFDNWTSGLGEPNSDQYYRYVKIVTLRFGGISDGLSKTIAAFADFWPDTIVFPNASKIAVVMEIRYQPDCPNASSISETDRTALQRITGNVLKALPKFSRATIEMRGSAAVNSQYVTREVFAEHGLHKLLPSVSAGLTIWDANIESSAFIREYPYLVSKASLTSLLCRYPIMGERAVDAIVRNAPILVTLVLVNFPMPRLKNIILDRGNNPIVYLRLKTFEYRVRSLFGLGSCEKIINGVSFPVLERVVCQAMYVFKDDALFRGCGKTLKHLNMQISSDAVKMLVESGVVESLRSLHSINLKFGHQPLSLQDRKVFSLQLAFGLVSQSTRSLFLCDFLDDYSIAETIALYPNTQNLIHLNLGSVKLQLTEAMKIIQTLPNLENFGYASRGLGTDFTCTPFKDLPGFVLKQYYPLSPRLKYCQINVLKRTPTRSLAVTAMLFAILCPRFTFAKVPDKILDVYNSTIKEAISDVPFLEYSDRLQCLLR